MHATIPSQHGAPTRRTFVLFAFALAALLLLALVVPHGRMGPAGHVTVDPVTKRSVFVHEERQLRGIGTILGQFAFTLLLASVLATYPLPWLRSWSPTRRLVTHVLLGGAILLLSVAHALLLALDQSYRGWLPGALSLVSLGAHGIVAALRGPLGRAWGSAWWRFWHHASAWAAFALTVEHVLEASWHFGLAPWFAQSGWSG